MTTALPVYIAVVDDDESYCNSIGRLLRATNYQPVNYASGEAFLADTKRPRFDCILLDIRLPGISGLELARRLAAVGSTTPVIYVTARDEPDIRESARATGCAAFISKLESSEGLLRAIAQVLERSNPN